jgi:hypothetical protein
MMSHDLWDARDTNNYKNPNDTIPDKAPPHYAPFTTRTRRFREAVSTTTHWVALAGASTSATVGAMEVMDLRRAEGQSPSCVPFTPMADPRTVNTDTGTKTETTTTQQKSTMTLREQLKRKCFHSTSFMTSDTHSVVDVQSPQQQQVLRRGTDENL